MGRSRQLSNALSREILTRLIQQEELKSEMGFSRRFNSTSCLRFERGRMSLIRQFGITRLRKLVKPVIGCKSLIGLPPRTNSSNWGANSSPVKLIMSPWYALRCFKRSISSCVMETLADRLSSMRTAARRLGSGMSTICANAARPKTIVSKRMSVIFYRTFIDFSFLTVRDPPIRQRRIFSSVEN